MPRGRRPRPDGAPEWAAPLDEALHFHNLFETEATEPPSPAELAISQINDGLPVAAEDLAGGTRGGLAAVTAHSGARRPHSR